MNGRFHETFNTLILLLLIFIFHSNFPLIFIITLSATWLLQTFIINNDLDSRKSNSKNRIGLFRYLFVFTKHRGAFHKVKSWIIVCIIILVVIYLKAPDMLYVGFFGCIGLLGSSVCHIVVDFVSTGIKRLVPNWIERVVKKVF